MTRLRSRLASALRIALLLFIILATMYLSAWLMAARP